MEATKFGRGGIEYMAGLLGCDRKLFNQGRVDLGYREDLAHEEYFQIRYNLLENLR